MTEPSVFSAEYRYILNDERIEHVYIPAVNLFENTNIQIIKEAQGVILRFRLDNPLEEYYNLTDTTKAELSKIVIFLAKIKNPAIIEVHTEKSLAGTFENLSNWEISTVIANNIENFILEPPHKINSEKIHSVGYGEFLPQKNTPNNGGKYLNRVDIIVLCNINGE